MQLFHKRVAQKEILRTVACHQVPHKSKLIGWGVIKSMLPSAQYDDYFVRQGLGQIICFGIDSMDPPVQTQIKTQSLHLLPGFTRRCAYGWWTLEVSLEDLDEAL